MESTGSPNPAGRNGHGRTSHDERRRVAIPRRSTKGPLEEEIDDPLSTPTAQPDRTSSPSSKAASRYHPRNASPTPSQASSLRSQPGPSALSQAHLSPRPSTDGAGLRDYSYLTQPTNFHPLPTSGVPVPFLQSPHQPAPNTPVEQLLRGGHFRHAAAAAALQLSTATKPSDTTRVFGLWHARLACLCLAGHSALAAQESKALGDLASAFYRDGDGKHVAPWELRMLAVRLQAVGFGDGRRGVMGCYELAREARHEAAVAGRAGKQEEVRSWEGRLRELGVRVADAVAEMGDLEAAARHLQSLEAGSGADHGAKEEPEERNSLLVYEAMVWLRVGNIESARRCLENISSGNERATSELDALLKTADGDFEAAAEAWTAIREKHPKDAVAGQNLAVSLMYLSRMEEARELLVSLHDESDAQSPLALTFNLATLYELCTERAGDRKLEMVVKDAARQPTEEGWERATVDYKL